MLKINGQLKALMLLCLMGLFSFQINAQDGDLRPVSTKYALVNATIVQAPGRTLQKGTVVLENGVIKNVGIGVTIPSDAIIMDMDSMYIYAGFISGLSNIGVPKPKGERDKIDSKLKADPPYDVAGITPGTDVVNLLSWDEKSVVEYRKLGFTAAQTVPHNGMMAGKGAFVLLGGNSNDAMILASEISLFCQLTGANGVYPNTVIGVMAKFRELHRKAKQAQDYERKYKSNSNDMVRPIADKTLEALYPVVNSQIPVTFKAEELQDVMRVLTLKNDLGFKLILGEVKQGWDAIPEIKASGSPVFLSLDLPELKEEKKKEVKKSAPDSVNVVTSKKEEIKEKTASDLEKERLEKRQKEMILKYYAQASQFQSSGIRFGFSTLESKSKDFKKILDNIIKNGLSEDQALAALTTSPAEILNVSSTMGTIDKGKMANLIITDKPYFDEKSNVRYVFVDGIKYEYESKDPKKKNSGDEAVNPAGKWNYTTETPQGQGQGVIVIEGSEGDYTGTMSLSFNESTNDITDIAIDGNTVSFSLSFDMGGQQSTMEVTMIIDGDTFEGTMSVGQFGSFPIEGSKVP